ncbi:hypothetical protein FCK90_02125 [Kocuria coralli]|uniref:Uncharacterized protein n=1 Tax=Kocuria coralli TaxID=1461025 RepID=A0A5J5KZW4_9MICC|nr:hypothetical protein [Kocuria coralli]KAA9395234.1 hypothetical protein FCK90_02125 [Kocuria coralli]
MRYLQIIVISIMALIIALAAAAMGGPAPVVVVIAMSVVIGSGWSSAVGIRARYRHNVIILTSGVLAAMLSWWQPDQRLVWLPAIVGMALIAIFIAELVRGEGARYRLESTISSVVAVLAVVSSSGWIALSQYLHDLGRSPVAPVLISGAVSFLVIGVIGARLIASAPKEGPRRGALSLGVTPVALLGPAVLVTSQIVGLVVA